MRERFTLRSTVRGGLVSLLCCGVVACSDQSDMVVEDPTPVETEETAPRYVVPTGSVEDESPLGAGEATPELVSTDDWQIRPPFFGAGEEPGWRLDVVGDWFEFQRLGLSEIESMVVDPERIDGADEFNSDQFKVVVRRGGCAHNTGGQNSVGSMSVVFNDVTYEGCVYNGVSPAAQSQQEQEVDPSDWVEDIQMYLVEANACLDGLAERENVNTEKVLVSSVFPRENNMIGVIIETRKGQVYECGTTRFGDVEYIDLVERQHVADKIRTKSRFWRQNGPPPRSCLRAKVIESEGQIMGYILPGKCWPR